MRKAFVVSMSLVAIACSEPLEFDDWTVPVPAGTRVVEYAHVPPDERTDAPQDAYEMAGHRGQYVIVVPSYDLVIVRRGLDTGSGEQEFPSWDLVERVVRALPVRPPGKKLTVRDIPGIGR